MSQSPATIPSRACPDCSASGKGWCEVCEGTNTYATRDGRAITPCWWCHGDDDADCDTCSGFGQIECHCGLDAPAVTPDGCCDECSTYPEDDPCPSRRQP